MLSVLPEDPTYALFYTCDWINPAAVKSGHMHSFSSQHLPTTLGFLMTFTCQEHTEARLSDRSWVIRSFRRVALLLVCALAQVE